MKTTAQKFDKYADMLREWSGRMNLVAPSTLDDIEIRHFADSAQLADVLPHGAKIVDLGSGAGFPAVVLAILGWDVTAIESIGKKTAFLSAVKDELNLDNLTIYHGRVEDFIKSNLPAFLNKNRVKSNTCSKNGQFASVFDKKYQKGRENDNKNEIIFTARAFAPLIRILDYIFPAKGRAILLKGREIENEIKDAKTKYKFDYELIPSKTGDGFILEISNISYETDNKLLKTL